MAVKDIILVGYKLDKCVVSIKYHTPTHIMLAPIFSLFTPLIPCESTFHRQPDKNTDMSHCLILNWCPAFPAVLTSVFFPSGCVPFHGL